MFDLIHVGLAMSGSVQFGNGCDVENGSVGLNKEMRDLAENDQIGKLEVAEQVRPRITFVDPAGDRYNPKTLIQ